MSLLGVLSDIHGNLPALEQALEIGWHHGVEDWICLGDVIDGGLWNNECARLIRDRRITTVRGNHDEDDIDGIAPDVADFLHSCPLIMERDGVFMTHISPRKRKRKVTDRYEAWNVFDETSHRLVFLGHSHTSAVWSADCATGGESRETMIELGRTYHLPNEDRHIISVGSLGYSRDSDPRPRFGTFDTATRMLTVHPVQASPIK